MEATKKTELQQAILEDHVAACRKRGHDPWRCTLCGKRADYYFIYRREGSTKFECFLTCPDCREMLYRRPGEAGLR